MSKVRLREKPQPKRSEAFPDKPGMTYVWFHPRQKPATHAAIVFAVKDSLGEHVYYGTWDGEDWCGHGGNFVSRDDSKILGWYYSQPLPLEWPD